MNCLLMHWITFVPNRQTIHKIIKTSKKSHIEQTPPLGLTNCTEHTTLYQPPMILCMLYWSSETTEDAQDRSKHRYDSVCKINIILTLVHLLLLLYELTNVMALHYFKCLIIVGIVTYSHSFTCSDFVSLGSPQWWCWRLKFSGMVCCVIE